MNYDVMMYNLKILNHFDEPLKFLYDFHLYFPR